MPIISDYWSGIDNIFEINKEILIAENTSDVLDFFRNLSEEERLKVGENARQKVLKSHTAKVRAKELENYVLEVRTSAKV